MSFGMNIYREHFAVKLNICREHLPWTFCRETFPDFHTPTAPAPPDELSDPNLTPLPTHPGIKYVARALAEINEIFMMSLKTNLQAKSEKTSHCNCEEWKKQISTSILGGADNAQLSSLVLYMGAADISFDVGQ